MQQHLFHSAILRTRHDAVYRAKSIRRLYARCLSPCVNAHYCVNIFSSTTMFWGNAAAAWPPPIGNHLTGCFWKKGQGGTMATKVTAVPARPTLRASVISWVK